MEALPLSSWGVMETLIYRSIPGKGWSGNLPLTGETAKDRDANSVTKTVKLEITENLFITPTPSLSDGRLEQKAYKVKGFLTHFFCNCSNNKGLNSEKFLFFPAKSYKEVIFCVF